MSMIERALSYLGSGASLCTFKNEFEYAGSKCPVFPLHELKVLK
jgi:hypothetical protein